MILKRKASSNLLSCKLITVFNPFQASALNTLRKHQEKYGLLFSVGIEK